MILEIYKMSQSEVFENYVTSQELDFYDSFDNENLNHDDSILKNFRLRQFIYF
jgi:hypothetical protein